MDATTHARFEAMKETEARITALNAELRDLGKAADRAYRGRYAGAHENYLAITRHIAKVSAEIKSLWAVKF